MKKLQLRALALGAKEILTREQLKSINGGSCVDTGCPGGYWCDAGTCIIYGGYSPPTSGSGSVNCPSGRFWCAAYGCIETGQAC